MFNIQPTLQSEKISLHLVGFGPHPGPLAPDLTRFVFFHDNYDFAAYWRVLRSSLAIATAFASRHYVTDQASSTVATALIVGTPLICDRSVLAAYRYLDEEDVWLLGDDENVVDGFVRVVGYGEKVWAAKRKRVVRKMAKSVEDNGRWVAEFLESTGRGNWGMGVTEKVLGSEEEGGEVAGVAVGGDEEDGGGKVINKNRVRKKSANVEVVSSAA